MSGISNGMRSKLKEENAQITQKKTEIRRILNNLECFRR